MRDFTRPADVLLREHINDRNFLPRPVSADNLIFGRPSTVLSDETGATAEVNMRGIENSDYRNRPAKVIYRRLDLGTLFQGANPEFTALGQSSLYRLLPELNKALGIQLTEQDVNDIDVRILGEGEQVNLEIRAKPESLAYSGFTRIMYNRRFLLLTDVVGVAELPILRHPDPWTDGTVAAGLLTWGLDFTLIYPDLAVNRYASWRRGNFSNLSALQASLEREYGIIAWPGNNTGRDDSGTIRDYATSQVARANKDFQRVVVQSQIIKNGYVGTAYFHYNRV